MSLAARIACGALVLVALVGFSGLFQLAIVDELAETASDLAAVDVEALALGLQLMSSISEMSEHTEKYLLLEDPRYLEQGLRVRATVERDLTALDGLALSPPEREAADRLLRLWREGAPALQAEPGLDVANRLREELAAFLQISRAQMRHKADVGASRARRARNLAWGATVAAIGLAALLSLIVARSVAVPMRRLQRGTSELARGNFAFRVDAKGAPEVKSLAEHFNFMSERLGELDRLKQDFVSNVSHDLKAPLASMLETTKLLLDEVPGQLNPRQRQLLALNLECGARLQSMITNVLDLARLDAGGVRYRMAPCDVERLVRDAIEEVAALAEKKSLDASFEVAPGMPRIAADENLLRRAFTNLLSNAVKFTPESSRMGVRLYPLRTPGRGGEAPGARRAPRQTVRPRAAVVCEVWDSGPGSPTRRSSRCSSGSIASTRRAAATSRPASGSPSRRASSKAMAARCGWRTNRTAEAASSCC